jgi:rRNA processing protein Krr1/Pno1
MATRLVIERFDDLDGSKDATIVQFSLDSVKYKIDLSEEHKDELYQLLARYIAAARKVTGKKKSVKAQPSTRTQDTSLFASTKDVRAWARGLTPDELIRFMGSRSGYTKVRDHGRLPIALYKAHARTHQQ